MLAKKIRQSKNQGLAARRAVAVMIDQSKYNLCSRQRRSIRLKGYDYSKAGAYSITICTHKHECLFGEIENREMRLNAYGLIARDQWEQLPKKFENIELGEFVVMPNHIHGIILIKNVHNETHIETKAVGARACPCPISI